MAEILSLLAAFTRTGSVSEGTEEERKELLLEYCQRPTKPKTLDADQTPIEPTHPTVFAQS